MAKHYSKEKRQLICDEFTRSSETQEAFAKSKNIGLSTLSRWLSERKRAGDLKEFTLSHPIQISKAATRGLSPIQVVLLNGVKVNVPPDFCHASLESIFSLLGDDHA